MTLSARQTIACIGVGAVVAVGLWFSGDSRVDDLVTRSLAGTGVTVSSLSGANASCMLNARMYGRHFEGHDSAGSPVSGTAFARPAFILPDKVMVVQPASGTSTFARAG